ncbi:hypothetical protein OIU77_002476 [Salix suchowensis]|uniref:Uncharacterized protein n=1 Tax=Salix suchowensis TaxID=1278906 RepID=A0ABQ9AXP9_9ROSI|nr:hypothetical protein OIU77_002476 [Salix suchowensis]
MGGGVSSLNVQFRKELDLENTEGEYAGLEHEVVPGVVESLKVTPNLYGNLIANTAAGIAGGTGVMPGGSR